ncbi:hypothetical protein M9H77_17256 [Catharanthus roseus]|uniref:Uncharacterized protein n=1 Tax=Catharanthus roseus TaxID=4058 RepID=A0ACC0B4G6_CATRO|nr:hypothetical protein M9H77_17256 [Catharanthus roseus]
MKLQAKLKNYYHNSNNPRFLNFYYLKNIHKCIKTIDYERNLVNMVFKIINRHPFEQSCAQQISKGTMKKIREIAPVDDSATVNYLRPDLKSATCPIKIPVRVLDDRFFIGIHCHCIPILVRFVGHIGIEFLEKVRVVIARNAKERNTTQPSKKIFKIKMSNDRLME